MGSRVKILCSDVLRVLEFGVRWLGARGFKHKVED